MSFWIHACILATAAASPVGESTLEFDVPSLQAEAAKADDFAAAMGSGRTWLNTRLRFENVEVEGSANDANATTLRTVLGYETGEYRGFRGLVEFEDVVPLGSDTYNSTTNGNTARPVVADPQGTEVNQVYVEYVGQEDMSIKGGRQVFTLDNHRFVGHVGWRQNQQTFDGVVLKTSQVEGVDITAALLTGVNRIFGDEHPAGDEGMESPILNVAHDFEGVGRLAGYAYFLDFDTTLGASTQTIGARFSGEHDVSEDVDVLYTVEYADQSDYADNPTKVDADYTLVELGVDVDGIVVKIASETLSGSGAVGDKFTTPLATLHKFNGFADVFLGTPDTGLVDNYITVAKTISEVKVAVTAHDFEADTGGLDYGSELDVVLQYAVNKRLGLGIKYADFGADSAGFVDVTKTMGWFTYKLL